MLANGARLTKMPIRRTRPDVAFSPHPAAFSLRIRRGVIPAGNSQEILGRTGLDGRRRSSSLSQRFPRTSTDAARQVTQQDDRPPGHDFRRSAHQELCRPQTRGRRGSGLGDVRGLSRAKSSACWAPTGPARRPACGFSAPCSGRPAGGRPSPATTSPRSPSEVRRSIGFMSGNTGIYDRMTAWELVAVLRPAVRHARRAAAGAARADLRPRCR